LEVSYLWELYWEEAVLGLYPEFSSVELNLEESKTENSNYHRHILRGAAGPHTKRRRHK